MSWHEHFGASKSATSIPGCYTIGIPGSLMAAGYNSMQHPRPGEKQSRVFILTARSPCAVQRRVGTAKCPITEFAPATTGYRGVGWPTPNSTRCSGAGIDTRRIGVGGDFEFCFDLSLHGFSHTTGRAHLRCRPHFGNCYEEYETRFAPARGCSLKVGTPLSLGARHSQRCEGSWQSGPYPMLL